MTSSKLEAQQEQTLGHTGIDDWSSPSDPDNPRNFSAFRRYGSIVAYTCLASVTTFAASAYSAGIGDVAREFGISEESATVPLSLFNLGLAFGPLIGAPLSETFGRKIVFLVTSPVFALFILGASFSTSLLSLTLCRFFAGVFAAPAVSNASASISDHLSGDARSLCLVIYYCFPTCCALLGSLVSGFVVIERGWRWTQYTTIFCIIAFYIPIIFTPESYKKVILARRARRLSPAVRSPAARSMVEAIRHTVLVLFLRPIHMLVTEPIVTLVCMYSGFQYGMLYTFVVAAPGVYFRAYGFDVAAQSLTFLGPVIATAVEPLPFYIVHRYVVQPKVRRWKSVHEQTDTFPPEKRLQSALVASVGLPACLFVFAWTARASIHWIVPVLFEGLAMLFSVMVYAPTNSFMIDAYGPLYGASASGASMFSRYVLSAAFPLFTVQMYQALGTAWATSLLAFCTLAMAPIPWLFYNYGDKLRSRSRYELST